MDFFKTLLMGFTLQEREKRAYKRYEIYRSKLESLGERALNERYVHLKTTYEYRKQVFLFFVTGLALSAVMGLWKIFFNYFPKILQLYLGNSKSILETQIIWGISSFLVIVSLSVLLVSVLVYLRNTYAIYRKLLIVEETVKTK